MTDPPPEPAPARPLSLADHVRETLTLAGPVMVSRLGILGLTVVDVLVLGRAGETPLADYVLGQSLYDGVIGLLYGLLLGVPVLTARAIGAGQPELLGQVWRRGLTYALLVGIAAGLLLQGAEPFLLLIGQDPEIAQRSAQVTRLLGLALAPLGVYLVATLFLEATNRPLPGTIAILIANVSNLFLNIVLVFGHFGLPALGAVGTAIATVLNSTGLALGLGLYVHYTLPRPQKARGARTGAAWRGIVAAWRGAAEQRRIGYAAGLSYGLEAGAFTGLTLVIGLLGVTALATHGVLFQLLGLTFMIAHGVATATQVRVSQAWGRGHGGDMARAGWIGLALATACNIGLVAIYLALPRWVTGLFTDEVALLAAAAPLMVWVAAIVLIDGGQTVMNLACRGRGDGWVPTALHFGSYLMVMVPGAWLLAIHLDLGLAGIYQAIAAASLLSVSGLSLRFAWLTRRYG